MAIAEARVGVLPRVVERTLSPAKPKLEFVPIEYPREEIEKLALLHFKNRPFVEGVDRNRMDASQAMILGIIEIQALVLTMLGQEHLLDGKLPTYEDVVKPRLIGEKQIKLLSEQYRIAKKKEMFMGSVGKSNEITPERARIRANMDELAKVLIEFGQENLVSSIDKEINPRFDRTNWDKIRSTGSGELQ